MPLKKHAGPGRAAHKPLARRAHGHSDSPVGHGRTALPNSFTGPAEGEVAHLENPRSTARE